MYNIKNPTGRYVFLNKKAALMDGLDFLLVADMYVELIEWN